MESVIEPTSEVERNSDVVEPKKHNPNPRGRKGKVLSTKRVADLEAMRFVFSHGMEFDKTYQHRELRKWLSEDRRGFMSQLMRLEAEKRSVARDREGVIQSDAAEPPVGPDETVAELRRLIGKLLDDADAQDVEAVTGGMA